MKTLFVLFLLLKMNFTFASVAFEKNIPGFKALNALIQSQSTFDSCETIKEITDRVRQTLIESSCANDSQAEYISCVQRTNSLNPKESKTLQLVLTDLNQINEEKCNAISKNQLAIRFDVISKKLLEN